MNYAQFAMIFFVMALFTNAFLIYSETLTYQPLSGDANNFVVKNYQPSFYIDRELSESDINTQLYYDINGMTDTNQLTPNLPDAPGSFGADFFSAAVNLYNMVIKFLFYYIIIFDYFFSGDLAVFGTVFKVLFILIQGFALFAIIGEFLGRWRK